jgi:DNA (cytosine-5)-methyltransferase 1
VLDLFSGIGGFALATEWAGGRTMAFCELAEFPSKVLAARWPDVPNLRDVTKLCRRIYDCDTNPDDPESVWCPRCDSEFGECDCIGTDQFTDTHGFPDVIAGGVPCQPASLVGKRRGSEDERWLWPDTLRIIGELRPRYCILENPRAILSLEGGDAFRGVLAAFARLGYDVQWDVVSASALGAGHRRERLWILASDSDCTRLEGHSGDGEAGRREEAGGHAAPENLRERAIASPLWYHQSGVQPVVNGIPSGLARDQLTAVGNSLVPQVALVWLRAIAAQIDARVADVARAGEGGGVPHERAKHDSARAKGHNDQDQRLAERARPQGEKL